VLAIAIAGLSTAGLAPSRGLAQAEDQGAYVLVEPFDRPEFTLQSVDGEARSIDEWNGNVVLLDFWASWCIPCREEMPLFDALRSRFHEQGFEVIGLAADQIDPVLEFLRAVPVSFPILHGNVFDVMGLSAEYGNGSEVLPFSVLIDRDGRVRYVQQPGIVTYAEAEKAILTLL
jgi:thiol-disulfide isomerase/thioredoxin